MTCSPLTWRQFVAWLFNMPWAPIAHLQALRCGHRTHLPPWNGGGWPLPQSIRGTNGAKKNLGETLDSRRRQESWCGMIQTTRDAPFGNPANRLSEKHLPEGPGSTAPAREVSPDFPDAHCQLALTCSAWRHLYEQKEELEVRMFRVSKAVRKAEVYICRLIKTLGSGIFCGSLCLQATSHVSSFLSLAQRYHTHRTTENSYFMH